MDLAVYIGELLGIQGEVCVPGLGCFVKTRVSGYYNEKENKFYPPSSQIMFDPQIVDDGVLVNYIATQKKISTTSSTYFVEKYITSLKEQIALYEVAFTDIGWLYSENAKLKFKANESFKPVDPEFFGYAPVKLFKVGQPVLPESPKQPADNTPADKPSEAGSLAVDEPLPQPVFNEAVPQPQALAEAEPEDEVYVEERSTSIWVILLIIFILTAGGLFAAYQYKPALFDKLLPGKKQSPAVGQVVVPVKKTDTVAKKPDSAALAAAKTDSAEINPTTTPTVDYTKVKHWELMLKSAPDTVKANAKIATLKKLGVDAKIVVAPGTRVHISIGTYLSRKGAVDADSIFLVSRKISEKPTILLINPK